MIWLKWTVHSIPPDRQIRRNIDFYNIDILAQEKEIC